jgi:hypothetical protein
MILHNAARWGLGPRTRVPAFVLRVSVLAARTLATRSVSHRFPWHRSTFAGLLTFGRVGDRVVVVVVVVAVDCTVCLPPPRLDGLLGRVARDQPVSPTDQVGPDGLDQGLADGEVVLQPTGWPA